VRRKAEPAWCVPSCRAGSRRHLGKADGKAESVTRSHHFGNRVGLARVISAFLRSLLLQSHDLTVTRTALLQLHPQPRSLKNSWLKATSIVGQVTAARWFWLLIPNQGGARRANMATDGRERQPQHRWRRRGSVLRC
jgi:hypothetical protein